MSENAYPFAPAGEGEDTTEAEYSAYFGAMFHGIRDGLQISANSSGLKVAAAAGHAWVRGHYYELTAAEDVEVGENTLTVPRVDTVVLHLEYGTPGGIELRLLEGVGSSAPPLVQTPDGIWQEPLANVTVAPGVVTIAPAAVADRRRSWIEAVQHAAGIFAQAAEPEYAPGRIWLRPLS